MTITIRVKLSLIFTYRFSLRQVRSISDRFGGDLDAEARYWTARIESDVAELTDDIVIGRANSYCELVVDLLSYINLILFLVNLGILCKCKVIFLCFLTISIQNVSFKRTYAYL